jgi:hypothetical protein
MDNVTPLGYMPVSLKAEVPWERLKAAIVVGEDEDGNVVFSASDMPWEKRIWLTQELVHLNQTLATMEFIEAVGGLDPSG